MNQKNDYIIYKHTNKINGKTYIGQTGQHPESRWGKNGRGYKEQMFYKAIQKYGWDNFEHEILYTHLTKEEANYKEIDCIKRYNSNDSNYGYNIESGGNTSILKSGSEHPNAIKVICLETKQIFDTVAEAAIWMNESPYKNHIYQACKGEHHTCGRHPVTKQPLHWLYLKDYNEKLAYERMNEKNKPDPKVKKIKCITTGQIFNDMKEAILWAGLKSKSGICLVCQGKRNFAGKHPVTKEKLTWEYFLEDGKESEDEQ